MISRFTGVPPMGQLGLNVTLNAIISTLHGQMNMSCFEALNHDLREQHESSDKVISSFELDKTRLSLSNIDNFEDRKVLNIKNGDTQLEDTIFKPRNGSSFDSRDLVLKDPFVTEEHNNYKDVSSQTLYCYQCDKLFDTNQTFTEHCISHNGGNKKTCSAEGIKNDNHKKKADIHLKPKIWKCKYGCGKIFTQEKYMNSHCHVMHEKVNKVQCKICCKFLSTMLRLKSHMLRHTNVKHLICLVCVKKRTTELSCMRHHLNEKHGINSKHSLFHDAYYQMSLKEISIMGGNESDQEDAGTTKRRKESIDMKSARDRNALHRKIVEKSKKVKNDLHELSISPAREVTEKKIPDGSSLTATAPSVRSDISNILQILTSKPQKIVTAENGMKLIKLSNGQFKKVNIF